jgi:hypothetical protein
LWWVNLADPRPGKTRWLLGHVCFHLNSIVLSSGEIGISRLPAAVFVMLVVEPSRLTSRGVV